MKERNPRHLLTPGLDNTRLFMSLDPLDQNAMKPDVVFPQNSVNKKKQFNKSSESRCFSRAVRSVYPEKGILTAQISQFGRLKLNFQEPHANS